MKPGRKIFAATLNHHGTEHRRHEDQLHRLNGRTFVGRTRGTSTTTSATTTTNRATAAIAELDIAVN